jgi:hypothetical protein
MICLTPTFLFTIEPIDIRIAVAMVTMVKMALAKREQVAMMKMVMVKTERTEEMLHVRPTTAINHNF